MNNPRLNRIFYREITGPCLIALLILTFVVFTREFGRLAEMLIRRNADGMTIAQIVLYILPSVLIFSIPFAFLIGTLIGFSRLSSDSEIIAMRASGVSVWQMLKPVLKVATIVAIITAAFTCSFLPKGNWNLRLLTHELGFKPLQSEIKPRVFNEQIPNTILYVEDVDLRTSAWKGVFVHNVRDGGNRTITLASRGDLVTSEDGRRVQLHLEDGTVYDTNEATPERDSLTRFSTQDVLLPLAEIETTFAKINVQRVFAEETSRFVLKDRLNEVGSLHLAVIPLGSVLVEVRLGSLLVRLIHESPNIGRQRQALQLVAGPVEVAV